jgi:hypothetical protein
VQSCRLPLFGCYCCPLLLSLFMCLFFHGPSAQHNWSSVIVYIHSAHSMSCIHHTHIGLCGLLRSGHGTSMIRPKWWGKQQAYIFFISRCDFWASYDHRASIMVLFLPWNE